MLQLLKRFGQGNAASFYFLFTRYVHQNHPGHKLPPPAYKTKLDLPDRYIDEANYPPVKPRLPPGEWPTDYRPSLAWRYWEEGEKFTRLKTIQERLSVMAYLNVQQTLDDLKQRRTRYFPIFLLSAVPKTPHMSPFVSYITKTRIETVSKAVSTKAKSRDESAQEAVALHKSIDFDMYEKLKHKAKETILMTFNQTAELPENHAIPKHPDTFKPESVELKQRNRKIELTSDALIKRLFTSMSNLLATRIENGHLVDAQYGNDVNIRAYWKRCGFEKVRPRGALPPDPDCIRFQFDDKAAFQIKCDKPLMPVSISFFSVI